MFFVIGLPSCFVLPCFATGCHTFGLKIATAALRPRNDTKLRRFYLDFCFMRSFFARCRSALSFKRFVPEIVSFPRKTYQSCHCEEGAAFAPDAAIFDGTICHPGTNYGCAERNRTLEGRARKRSEAANPMFFVIGLPSCFVLPCFATGCHAFGLKIATAALRPRNDTELGRFYLENRRFLFYAVVFCAVSLCTVFQTFRSGNCFVFPQNRSVLSLRGGRVRPTRQSLTKQFLYCFCRIWELVLLFSPASRLFFQKNDVS